MKHESHGMTLVMKPTIRSKTRCSESAAAIRAVALLLQEPVRILNRFLYQRAHLRPRGFEVRFDYIMCQLFRCVGRIERTTVFRNASRSFLESPSAPPRETDGLYA